MAPFSVRYDLPWKAALTHAFQDFMRFFFPALHRRIDWRQPPRFRDKELAGLSLAPGPTPCWPTSWSQVQAQRVFAQQSCHDPNQLYMAKWQLPRLMFRHEWNKERILGMFK